MAVFWQVRLNEFIINFDDDLYIFDNSHVKAGLTREGFVWAFTTTHAYNWHPITWMSHMLDCQLYGLNPAGHHFTNVLFHIANTLLLFLVLRRMSSSLWCSAFVAALFALHPLHVESVAWASERKDVLSTFFWMLTMWLYIRYTQRPGFATYLPIMFTFALGLMAKQMLVTLPFVLLLLDYWPLGRFTFPRRFAPIASFCKGAPVLQKDRKTGTQAKTMGAVGPVSAGRCILEKLPLLILSAAASATVYLIQQQTGIMKSVETYPLVYRVQNALVAYTVYIGKMLWPGNLAIFYPYPYNGLPVWKVAGAVLLLVCITAAALWKVRRYPWLAVGWLWYLGTLVPVIGLVQVGRQAMANRYTYVPLTGLFIIIAWGVPVLFARLHYRKAVLSLSAAVLLSVLGAATWCQVRHWRNTMTLYKHATAVVQDNWWAHEILGVTLFRQGKLDEAIKHHTEALRIRPDFINTHCNLGALLTLQGKLDEAITHFTEALRIRPDFADAHCNLGTVLTRQGKLDEAIKHYTQALAIKQFGPELTAEGPDVAQIHHELGILLARQGRVDEAIKHYTEALRIKPDYADAHCNLGVSLARQGRVDEAIKHYTEALAIKPNFADAHSNFGVTLTQRGDFDEAIKHLNEALRIKPDWPKAHYNLGYVYYQQGKFELSFEQFAEAVRLKPDYLKARINLAHTLVELGKIQSAVEHYYRILQIKPDKVNVLKSLSWILATTEDTKIQNPTDAVKYAERACELTNYNQPRALDTLAVAYAAADRFGRAIETAEKAIKLAEAAGKKDLAEEIQNRLRLYQAGRPYRKK